MGYPRYRFDKRFDEHAEAPAAPPPEPEIDPLDVPVHSERTLRQVVGDTELRAFAEGVEQGRDEGRADAEASIQAALVRATGAVAERLTAADEQFATVFDQIQSHGSAVIVTLVRRLAPRLLERVARADIECIAAEALRVAGSCPVLRVRVAPALAGAVRDRLAAVAAAQGFKGEVLIDADDTLGPDAVDANWEAGGVTYDAAEIGRVLDDLADRAIATLADKAGQPDRAHSDHPVINDMQRDGTASCPR
ncbi:MAG TPA: fliH protein [Azospirillum sp.]|nr:fliH protein [Azospirillum sp.]